MKRQLGSVIEAIQEVRAIARMEPEFQKALDAFLAAAQGEIDADWKKHGYTHSMSPVLGIDVGPKYVRVHKTDRDKEGKIRDDLSRSAYCFIDRSNGDVLKSESWKRPAKHPRGNIFDPDHGVGGITPYGGRYLR